MTAGIFSSAFLWSSGCGQNHAGLLSSLELHPGDRACHLLEPDEVAAVAMPAVRCPHSGADPLTAEEV